MINELSVNLTPATARKLIRFSDDEQIHDLAKTDLVSESEVKEYFNDLYDEDIQNAIQQLTDNLYTGTIIITKNNDQYVSGIIQYIKSAYAVVYDSNEAFGYAKYRLRIGNCKIDLARPDNRFIYINDSFRNPRMSFPKKRNGVVNIIMTPVKGVDGYIEEIASENNCSVQEVRDNLDVLNISII